MELDYVELPEDLFIYSGKERGKETRKDGQRIGKGGGKEARRDGEQGKKEGRKSKDKREVGGSYAVSIPEPSGPVGMAPAGRAHRFIHTMM